MSSIPSTKASRKTERKTGEGDAHPPGANFSEKTRFSGTDQPDVLYHLTCVQALFIFSSDVQRLSLDYDIGEPERRLKTTLPTQKKAVHMQSDFSLQAKRGEAVKGTLSPVWDTMVEILVADFTQVS